MSTEPERNLEAEVPDGVSPTATDSAASYGPSPLSESDMNEAAAGEPADATETADEREIGDQPLFGAADRERLRGAWRQLQGSFVDNPHEAVTQADDLVMATVQQLSATLAERKQSLERLWSRTEDGDTEDLRLALRSYRAFFEQLVGTDR
ncbi:hypothetical protein ACW2Q0_08555 [Nocardia sp. R16R-3T]